VLPFALLAATAALHRGLEQLQSRVRLPRFERAAYWRTVVTLYFFTFNSVTRACLGFFNCSSLPSGRYMAALPAVLCDEAAYRGLTPLVVLLLMAYVAAIPGFIGYRLRGAHGRESDGELARVWSVVYGPLRPGVFWWGMAQMLARAALVAAAVFVRGDDDARYAIFALINVFSLVLLMHFKPNRSAGDNAWELGTLLSLVLLALSESMGAVDEWLALLTLGVGAAIAVRLGAQGLRRLATAQRGDDADEGSSQRASERVAASDGLPMSAPAYVALEGDAL
jgi:hypothetical protein